jgi:hypothetical protein
MNFKWFYAPTSYSSFLTGSALYHYVITDRTANAVKDLSPAVSISGFDWSNASYHALKQMRPTIENGLLTPNFIAELGETGASLLQFVRTRQNRAERQRSRDLKHNRKVEISSKNANYKRNWENSLLASLAPQSSVWNRTIGAFRKLAKRVAWANLAWQFAVRPTFLDAKKIALLIEGWSSTVAELIRKAEVRQVRHYARPVDNLYTLPPTLTSANYLFEKPCSVERKSEHLVRPFYRASMLFTYDASSLKGLYGQFSGLISALGANRVASVIWEAIPFSFIIDWFVNVGDVIASLEDQVIDPLPIVIHDFSASLKYAYRTKLKFTWDSKIVTDIAYRDTSVYERRIDAPSMVDSLSVHLPNLNQVGLGLSLIVCAMDGITSWKRRG